METLIILLLVATIGVLVLRQTNRHKFEEIKYNLKNWFNK